VTDIKIDAALDGVVTLRLGASAPTSARVSIRNRENEVVAAVDGIDLDSGTTETTVTLQGVRPWSPSDPHLYTARVELLADDDGVIDRYDEHFGVREVKVDGDRLLLNGQPLFLTGFGKHEDYPVVGRGQHRAVYVKDFELLRWTGANSFRTSHYPYDEEIVRLADRLGFLVIDEVPAVSLGFWSDDFDELRPLLDNHKKALSELIARDANHPSVISWSIVNEANLWAERQYQNEASRRYFEEVYEHVKSLDDTRPVLSIIMAAHQEQDVALEACDVIGLNRYFGWYTEPVDLNHAVNRLDTELEAIHERFGKPIIMTEFGADTIEGYHATTAQMFTEEFQIALLMAYAGKLAEKDYCAGMHVWNFGDFRTPQHFRRVVLNKKGVFTRSRDPKGAAFALKRYWTALDRVAAAHRPMVPAADHLVEDLKRPLRWRNEADDGSAAS
jgi:beta-glucuronidase